VRRLDRRIRRSKRSGKLVLAGVLAVSAVLGLFLVQALVLAGEAGRGDLMARALVGLGVLLLLDVASILLVRRQHRLLDEAREEFRALVQGRTPPSPSTPEEEGPIRPT